MKLVLFTIVLDGMPYIGWHLPVLNQLKDVDWRWIIAEGAAMNYYDTGWCKSQSPRLSWDGTTEYLNSIRRHPRVTVLQQQQWNGKTEQCNACLEQIKEPCILLQVDCDELWTAQQLRGLLELFQRPWNSARFFCQYRVGPNLIVTSENTYGNKTGEWHRAWRYTPGMRFERHEPPVMNGIAERCATREFTRDMGLVFDHWAYALEAQVKFKEFFYGYTGAVQHCKRLQAHNNFPTKLNNFLP